MRHTSSMAGGRPEPRRGVDGHWYFTVTEAALLLGVERGHIHRDASIMKVAASVLEEAPTRRGRPAQLVVPAEVVSARRRDLLARLFAVDAREAAEMVDRDLRLMVDELDQANAALRARVLALEEVVRLSIITDGARLEQLRQLLGPSYTSEMASK